MTINRKEKVLIFVLILFLLVGGTFTLGVMPKNNDKKTAQEELQTVQSEISKVQRQNDAVSPSKFNKLVEEISKNETALKQLTSTKNNMNEELLPSDMPGHQDMLAISDTIERFFGEHGMLVKFTLAKPVTTATKKIYTVSSAYEVESETLYEVVDAIARVKSFNLVSLSMKTTEDGKVTGTLTMTITYLLNE